jgi:hypothetical protein
MASINSNTLESTERDTVTKILVLAWASQQGEQKQHGYSQASSHLYLKEKIRKILPSYSVQLHFFSQF